MPTFEIYDVFCVNGPAPTNGANIDLAGATVLDPVSFEADANANGDPYATVGGTTGNIFNGENITQTGDMKFEYVDCEGNTGEGFGNYITTDAGNTYYLPHDSMGDITFDSITTTSINSFRQNTIEGALVDDDQTVCPTSPPCFTPDMPIETLHGPVKAGELQIGDMVRTYDNGFQEVQFIYRRKMKAEGAATPVLFKKGAIGNTEDLLLSQRHRMYTGSLPEELRSQLKGAQDNLLQAVQFCNGSTVRLAPEVGEVEYIQIMFENHELLYCNGTVSESWQPTASALRGAPDVAEELMMIFPEIAMRRAFMPGAQARDEVRLKSEAA